MATVVITFFLITLFYVCKMDADCRKKRRNISQRENRWSMNSQRLEEIVAELMKPISDVHRSFDTDISALLEEYLTEAGLHALDSEEEEEGNAAIPNFPELALLLQQSAAIYGRKVDCLYQYVINVSDSLNNSVQEVQHIPEEPQTPSTSRRRRKASVHEGFSLIELNHCAASRRERAPPRPPPTLPRMYIELEPRVISDADFPLLDYSGEPVGLLNDFHVMWRLQGGQLLEDLAEGCDGRSTLRALPLTELEAAIAAAAPPSPPPPATCVTPPPSPAHCPPCASTPLPELPPPSVSKKRKNDGTMNVLDSSISLTLSKKGRSELAVVNEFSIPKSWIRRVVSARRQEILELRRRIAKDVTFIEFRGFDISESRDIGGFLGWSRSELTEATLAAEAAEASITQTVQTMQAAQARRRRADESDDDGFFERSSLGDSDGSRVEDCATGATALAVLPGAQPEWVSWRERVVARANAAEAQGVDIQSVAANVLGAAERLPPCTPFNTLLHSTVSDQSDVSKVFLATLFLANAGNVEIVQGAPLTLNSFSVRVVSADERQQRASTSAASAASADEQLGN